MSESDHGPAQSPEETVQSSGFPHEQQPPPQSQNAPFQAQLESFSPARPPASANLGAYGQPAFDMAALANNLPAGGPPNVIPRPRYEGSDPHSPAAYSTSPSMPLPGQRPGPPFGDPSGLARAQPQQPQFLGAQYYAGHSPIQNLPRQGFPMQVQIPFSPMDPYGYGMNQIDPRFMAQAAPFAVTRPPMPADIAPFHPRGAETAPIPAFPRGPPRKPKQSGHALWVGNLPPAASVTDLKDHFSREATRDIESVFLIAKSNCAFVNYRTEAACIAAMHRFHDSRFHGVRLVCRLRRGASSANNPAPPEDAAEPPTPSEPETAPTPTTELDGDSPTIARSDSREETRTGEHASTATDGGPAAKVSEKYFIVKSLTAQDLEASVRNGIWATQSHNEVVLNRAFEQADNVFLIFSANKSGEYFGYARMASRISGEPVNLSTMTAPTHEGGGSAPDPSAAVSPQSIPTPATSTAPRGRIIDDSARGTIFWEASSSSDSEDGSPDKSFATGGNLSSSGQTWGRQFRIEWLSTNRLPFYRTRGLRNPWNSNREVKIARDGTELEPTVGRRLVSMFFRMAHSPAGPPAGGPLGGMAPR